MARFDGGGRGIWGDNDFSRFVTDFRHDLLRITGKSSAGAGAGARVLAHGIEFKLYLRRSTDVCFLLFAFTG